MPASGCTGRYGSAIPVYWRTAEIGVLKNPVCKSSMSPIPHLAALKNSGAPSPYVGVVWRLIFQNTLLCTNLCVLSVSGRPPPSNLIPFLALQPILTIAVPSPKPPNPLFFCGVLHAPAMSSSSSWKFPHPQQQGENDMLHA